MPELQRSLLLLGYLSNDTRLMKNTQQSTTTVYKGNLHLPQCCTSCSFPYKKPSGLLGLYLNNVE